MESQFNKKFNFIKNPSWKVPECGEFYSGGNDTYASLQVIKSILNFVKHKLDDFKIEEWSDHTRKRNPAQLIVFHLKNEIKAEFVTQAFTKLYECLCSYPLIPTDIGDKFFAVYLCEAPGAFITATNHFLKLHHPDTNFHYRATTLNPYYEGNSLSNTILDDRLILHTLPNWFFGDSYSGDIMDEGNIRSLVEYCKALHETGGAPMLVTGDGSIDCLDNPECQEEYVSKLHTSEFITALALLANGGSLLLKFFTFYETTTVSMLYVMNCCFESVHVFKPASSKEGNSEVYVIAIGYHKELISDELIDHLLCSFKSSQNSMLPLKSIPQDFLEQVNDAAKFFMNLQVSVIEGNIKSFRRFDKYEVQRLKGLKSSTVQYYMQHYDVRPIKDYQKLLHVEFFNDINLNVRVHSGSHAERISFHNLCLNDQIQVLYDRLKYFYELLSSQPHNRKAIELKFNEKPQDFLNLIHGKPIVKVVSSKFILVTIMKYFIELRDFVARETSESPMKAENGAVIVNIHCLPSHYDSYEKSIVKLILSEMLKQKSEEFIIKDLLIITQFLVGFLMYLGSFVYNEILFEVQSGQIKLSSLKDNGINSIKYLLKTLNQSEDIIGICDTKFLFTFNAEFYRSVIDFNNKLCLKYCSSLLNFISRTK